MVRCLRGSSRCTSCENKGSVPPGQETTSRHNTVRGSPFAQFPKLIIIHSEGDVVNVHYRDGDDDLTIQDNHPTDANPSNLSKSSTPLRLDEDDDFDEGFFSSSPR